MAEAEALSMVGGTIRRKLIHRESFGASVLHLLDPSGAGKHCREEVSVDNPFALIEGHPEFSH